VSAAAARADAPPAPTGDARARRLREYAPAIAACVVLICAIASITPDPIGVFWDDGVYLLSAKALVAGDGYRLSYLPGMPPAIHYPPLFPLLLAALLKVTPAFPANVAVLKLVNPICLAVGVFGAATFATRFTDAPRGAAAISVAICAVIAPVLVLTNVLLSESLFFAVLIGALWLVEETAARGGARRAILAGLAIAALALVRTVGGVLLPAAFAVLWWRHRRRDAALLAAGAIVALAPYQWWVWQAARGFPDELRGSYGPYLEWVVGGYRNDPSLAWQVFSKNVADLWRAFGIVFAPRLPRVVQWFAAGASLAALTIGTVALLRRASALGAFVVPYAIVVLLWPYNPERFVWAVWPLVALLLLAATRDVGRHLSTRWRHAPRAAAIVVVVLLAGQAAYAARGLANGWASAPQRDMTERLWPLVQWTVTHAGPGDIVASDAHVMIALYTGRTTMPVSILTPAEHVRDKSAAQYAHELEALMARYRPRLIVLSRGTPEIDAVPIWAAGAASLRVTPLSAVPGGGAAFAVRALP
jgi:hypothetical protein